MSYQFITPSYINIIGTDGSGKSTAYDRYVRTLQQVVTLREPGGSPQAEEIRHILLGMEEGEREERFRTFLRQTTPVQPLAYAYVQEAWMLYQKTGMTGEVEMFLYAASRADTNQRVVKASLEQGLSVFGSRSVACSMAYQGYARGLGMKRVWDVNEPTLYRYPDAEVYFDLPTSVAMERIRKRTGKQDRLDLESEAFHERTREGYLVYYRDHCPYPHHIIDASRSPDDVYAQLEETLRPYTKRVSD